jgi:hypothetical protein
MDRPVPGREGLDPRERGEVVGRDDDPVDPRGASPREHGRRVAGERLREEVAVRVDQARAKTSPRDRLAAHHGVPRMKLNWSSPLSMKPWA